MHDHVVFHSSDMDEAREQVAKIFCPHLLAPVGRGGIDARHHSVALGPVGGVTLNYVTYRGDVRIVPGALESFYVWQVPLSGTAEIRCGTRRIVSRPGVASVPDPDEDLEMRWSPDCDQLIMQADRGLVEEHLAARLGRELTGSLRPQLGWDLRRGAAGSWWQLVRLVVNGIDRDATLLEHPLAVAHLVDGLLAGVLEGPHSYTRFVEAEDPRASRREVWDLVDLIEAHPDQPWTVTGFARWMGVSVRTLQRAFGYYVGVSPMDALRHARLRRARGDLLVAGPGQTSIPQTAWRWGYTDPARFADDYHRLHGETPWLTLGRRAAP